MKAIFVDADVLLRFLTEDDEDQRVRARHLFREATAGNVALLTGPPVLFEVAWVLRTVYGHTKSRVLDALEAITALAGLQLTDAELVDKALSLARQTNQDFADAYIHVSAQAQGADSIATFNRRHFERMGAALFEWWPE